MSEIQNNFAKYQQYNLQEKIYVHTDRSAYICGEVLWFKAYIQSAATNKPLSLSKVVYVELLNTLHQPVLQCKAPVQNESGSGSFFLPFSLPSGNYELRAYTNWMKNFSSDYYFTKNINVINTTKSLDPSATVHASVDYHAAFFPEGGNLVNGLQSEIAFKVTDNVNKGINCEGVIVDQVNDTILDFKILRFGIGHFYLTPETGKVYTAVIDCKDGSVIRKNLPKAYAAGYVLHVADSGDNDLKIVISKAGVATKSSQEVFTILQNSGHINYAKSLTVENGPATWVINKDSLESGITEVTIFDSNRQPLCERLYFKRPKNKMLITAKTDKTNYRFRDKVLIDVTTIGQSGLKLAGNLSASVFRLDSLHQPDQENIFSYLWLSSNLRGNIEDPSYYFNNENAEINEALDNLVLAQGWRKFDWEKVLQNKAPSFEYFPEYSGHIITGKITSEATKQPVPDVLVYLSVPGRRIQLKGCISDSAGIIHFDMKDFYGANQVVVQTNTGDDSLYHLEIFSPFSEKFSDTAIPAFHVSENETGYLRNENFHMQVENSYHGNDLQKFAIPLIDSLMFYKKPTKTYLLDDYTRFTTMEEVMREYVDEIDVRRRGENFRLMSENAPAIPYRDMPRIDLLFKKDPLVLLDGVPVFNIDKLMGYDPLKVQKLDVVASKYHWGPVTAYGIASLTTYKANLEGYTLDPGDLILDYDGLQQQRIFYSPDYASDEARQNRLPDFRDVLYWSPGINTSVEGKSSFSFYTGDVPGKYLVVVEGISSNGDAGSASALLEVEK